MKPKTILTSAGRKPREHHGAVNVPAIGSSTILFESLQAYEYAEGGKGKDGSYGIAGMQTHRALESALCQLEKAEYCTLTPSGLQAITLTLQALVKSGDHVLIVDSAYGPTRRFCNQELKKFGVETSYYDPQLGAGIEALIQENTAVILLESPGSLTFEVQDIPAIVRIAKEKGITTVKDNSWSAGYFYQPLEHGVDISLQVLTKYIGGHSDILLGSVLTKQKALYEKINKTFRNLGISVGAQSCYLALRGMRTLAVRLQQHYESALKVAEWLEKHPKVQKILYPALPSFEGYDLWKRDFTGANGLLSFLLDKQYGDEAVYRFTDNMQHFAIGASWGGYESLILRRDPKASRSATPWPHEETLIRIHVGLEDVDDLIEDMEKGLARL